MHGRPDLSTATSQASSSWLLAWVDVLPLMVQSNTLQSVKHPPLALHWFLSDGWYLGTAKCKAELDLDFAGLNLI